MLDRKGETVGVAVVRKIRKKDKSMIITVESSKNLAMEIRNIRVKKWKIRLLFADVKI